MVFTLAAIMLMACAFCLLISRQEDDPEPDALESFRAGIRPEASLGREIEELAPAGAAKIPEREGGSPGGFFDSHGKREENCFPPDE